MFPVKSLMLVVLSIFSISFVALQAQVVLQDSSVIHGKVVEFNDSTLTLKNDYIGTIVVPKRYLLDNYIASADRSGTPEKTISPNDDGSVVIADDPNTNLVFVPTARTCKKGVFDFKDFELLFLTLSYSPTSTTILSGGFLFPVSSDLQLYSFAVKQQLYASSSGMFSAALMGQITKPVGNDDINYFWNSFAIASFQPSSLFSLHGCLLFSGAEIQQYRLMVTEDSWDEEKTKPVVNTSFNYMFGMELVPTRHSKFIIEFFDNLGVLSSFNDSDEESYFLNFAVRLFWKSISVDIAGLRPIVPGNDFGSLILIPCVNISYRFGNREDK